MKRIKESFTQTDYVDNELLLKNEKRREEEKKLPQQDRKVILQDASVTASDVDIDDVYRNITNVQIFKELECLSSCYIEYNNKFGENLMENKSKKVEKTN